MQLIHHIDTSLFLLINGLNSPWADRLMYLASGRLTWLPLYLFALAWIIIRFKKLSLLIIPLIILLITASDQASVHLFKNVFERLRPCHEPDLTGLVHLVRDHCGGTYGFVSSHAANTGAFAAFSLLLFRHKAWSLAVIFWALLVGYSRIYLGVHYPGDVLGGFVAGALLGWLFFRLARALAESIFNQSFTG